MLKIVASFSKKVPAEAQYSSVSYFCTLEREVPDSASVEQSQSSIHSTFEVVKDAVEAELSGKKPEKPALAAQTSKDASQKADAEARASNRQIKFITDLATAQGVGLSELNDGIKKRFGIGGLYDLSRREASLLLDSMKGPKKAA